ncbi:hypothetical protein PIB30_076321 [Stylosanthes scabra]|uniref:Uncharacterized protein n=1 Tax=Stylosanthes scabra TaxID=79078 RepID=A0ABU6WQ16_9FABA|nr:hypothetical protein [Stylosanthes scabra]
MNNSIEAPTRAETTPIFKYQSRNFIFQVARKGEAIEEDLRQSNQKNYLQDSGFNGKKIKNGRVKDGEYQGREEIGDGEQRRRLPTMRLAIVVEKRGIKAGNWNSRDGTKKGRSGSKGSAMGAEQKRRSRIGSETDADERGEGRRLVGCWCWIKWHGDGSWPEL